MLRLLEDVGLPEVVIQLASLAITEARRDSSSQVTVPTQQHVSYLCADYIYGSKPPTHLSKYILFVLRLLCGLESSNIIWTSDTTVKPMKL